MNKKVIVIAVVLLVFFVLAWYLLQENRPHVSVTNIHIQYQANPISYVIDGSGNVIGNQNEVVNTIKELS